MVWLQNCTGDRRVEGCSAGESAGWASHHILVKSRVQVWLPAFSRVTAALLSFLTLSVAPYLKKPLCQTNLEDEVRPKGRGLFIGVVEQQTPAAIKRRLGMKPFIRANPSSRHLYFFPCFSLPLLLVSTHWKAQWIRQSAAGRRAAQRATTWCWTSMRNKTQRVHLR